MTETAFYGKTMPPRPLKKRKKQTKMTVFNANYHHDYKLQVVIVCKNYLQLIVMKVSTEICVTDY